MSRFFLCVFPVLFLVTSLASATIEQNYSEKAKGLSLQADPYWLKLLHYESGFFGTKSTADSSGFFLASDGDKNAESELKATIAAIFAPIEPERPDHHARCKFIARTQWLIAKLAIDENTLPTVRCGQYEAFRRQYSADALSLVFGSYNINSSASLFGHTFLRLRRKSGEDHALSYLAVIGTSNFFAYIYKGFFGGYHGSYLLEQYDQKARDYLFNEQRNMWEFELNMNAVEIERMFRHMWELANTHFDYYFLTENCSYNLFLLLEIARPGIELVNYPHFFVHPADTMKVMAAKSELWTGLRVTFSATEQYDFYYGYLSPAQRKAFSVAINSKILPDTELGRRTLLAYLQFRKYTEKLDAAEEENLKVLTGMQFSSTVPVMPPSYGNPAYAHETALLSAGGGISQGGIPFSQIIWRPTLHDFLDSYAGYPPTMQLIAMEANLRYYFADKPRLELASLDMLNLVSLKPVKPHIFQTSYEIQSGFRPLNREFAGADNQYFWFGHYGYGLAAEFPVFHHVLAYALPGLHLELGPGFTDYYRAGIYADAGLVLRVSEYFGLLTGAQYKLLWGKTNPDQVVAFTAGFNAAFSTRFALENKFQYVSATQYMENSLYLKYYF